MQYECKITVLDTKVYFVSLKFLGSISNYKQA